MARRVTGELHPAPSREPRHLSMAVVRSLSPLSRHASRTLRGGRVDGPVPPSPRSSSTVRSVVRRSLPAVLLLALSAAAPASASAATLYLSPSGSDSAACSQAAPCKTFSRAYSVAAAGSDVIVAGGTYGGQSLDTLPA